MSILKFSKAFCNVSTINLASFFCILNMWKYNLKYRHIYIVSNRLTSSKLSKDLKIFQARTLWRHLSKVITEHRLPFYKQLNKLLFSINFAPFQLSLLQPSYLSSIIRNCFIAIIIVLLIFEERKVLNCFL